MSEKTAKNSLMGYFLPHRVHTSLLFNYLYCLLLIANKLHHYFAHNVVRRLLLPKMDHRGVVCVDFYYHMFGFHVRSLRLVHRSPNSAGSEVSRTTWLRSRDMGNVWYHGNSQVDISPNSQVCSISSLILINSISISK